MYAGPLPSFGLSDAVSPTYFPSGVDVWHATHCVADCAGVITGCTDSSPILNPLRTVPPLVVQYTMLPLADTGAIAMSPSVPRNGPAVSAPFAYTALRIVTWMVCPCAT